ncbi:hypothetical protein ACFSJU_14960 [Paradesertivirga mongoliensis]|uniref:Uncharacterized protein n=1 Tax=Paradesertivirga mongoliensis TaxID=2100740 RepID=A0ABW4ZNK0_9SPHI|nr:hypothetical protein [Pedobacter mongoliensis]
MNIEAVADMLKSYALQGDLINNLADTIKWHSHNPQLQQILESRIQEIKRDQDETFRLLSEEFLDLDIIEIISSIKEPCPAFRSGRG